MKYSPDEPRGNPARAGQLSQRAKFSLPQPISHLMHTALARPELISLAAGFVDQQSLPVTAADKALEVLFDDKARARAALQYGTNQGHRGLRQAVLDRFLKADGPGTPHPPTVDQVVLTAGSNQLLHLVCEVLLDPGDIVICAAPCYFVFLGILQGLGVRAVGVAIDADGMIPEALEEELSRRAREGELDRVRAIYNTSYFDNPSTVTLSAQRRQRIVEIARRTKTARPIYVIDDAAYRQLRYAASDVPSMRHYDADGDRVIVAETFSKSFSPGIRVGWGILPKELVEPVTILKSNVDFGSPNFNQELMAVVLEQGLFEPHVAQLRESYRVKMAAMLDAIQQYLGDTPAVKWHVPEGGLYVWLELPQQIDTGPNSTLVARALDEGVLYVPGEYCYPSEGEPRQPNKIRLSFGVQSAENIKRGIEALARAVRSVR